MISIRAPGVNTLSAAIGNSVIAEEGFCPRCGMHYRYYDGVLYPLRHGDGHTLAHRYCGTGERVCDACHLEEAMSNITARRSLHHIVNKTLTQPSLKRQVLIPERKRRLISSISETMGSFALSRQEIGNVIDLCSDVEMANTLLSDAASIKTNCGFTVEELRGVLAGAYQRLSDYIANLDDRKRHELYSMMLLGRNLDYFGLCQEAVVEFMLRVLSSDEENERYYSAEKIAGKRELKNWLKFVLDLVEG